MANQQLLSLAIAIQINLLQCEFNIYYCLSFNDFNEYIRIKATCLVFFVADRLLWIGNLFQVICFGYDFSYAFQFI